VATLRSDKKRSEDLVERLNRHPEFRDKVEELLDIADNKSGDASSLTYSKVLAPKISFDTLVAVLLWLSQ
jgi:hypothetical protein